MNGLLMNCHRLNFHRITAALSVLLLFLVAAAIPAVAFADSAPPTDGGDRGTIVQPPEPDEPVLALLARPDGSAWVGGAFENLGGQPRRALARLLPSGALDTEFDPPSWGDIEGSVEAETIVEQPDGRLLANLDGVIGRLVRLQPNGSLDASFNSPIDTVGSNTVNDVLLLPGGGWVVVGAFGLQGGIGVYRNVRLLPSGEVDGGYSPPGTGGSPNVRNLARQDDGKILISGRNLLNVGGGSPLVRLHPDGTLDESFDFDPAVAPPGGGSNPDFRIMELQADGKILVGGGLFGAPLLRLNSDGSLDESFSTTFTTTFSGFPSSLAILPDGKILAGGSGYFLRLNVDGSVDTGFTTSIGGGGIQAISLLPDGRILIGGSFATINDIPQRYLARLRADGSLDVGPGVPVLAVAPSAVDFGFVEVDAQAAQSLTLSYDNLEPDGDGPLDLLGLTAPAAPFLVDDADCVAHGPTLGPGESCTIEVTCAPDTLGVHESVLGILSSDPDSPTEVALRCEAVADLPGLAVTPETLAFGEVDVGDSADPLTATLTSIGSAPVTISAISVPSMPFAFEGGDCPAVPFQLAPGASCSLEYGFAPPVGGDFAQVVEIASDAGSTGASIAVLTLAGYSVQDELPPSFYPPEVNSVVYDLAMRPDGGMFAVGAFTEVSGLDRRRVVSLHADGQVDTSFADPVADGYVASVALQADGKIVVGGAFQQFGDGVGAISRSRIARLNNDGSVDTSFDPGLGANGSIGSVAVQADGKILIVGAFTSFHGVGRNRVARLNPDGSLDLAFDPNVDGINVQNVTVQADGKILIGGKFDTVSGQSHISLARLNSDGSLDPGFAADIDSHPNNLVYTMTLQSDGKILVGGRFGEISGVARTNLARLHPDGTVDVSFASPSTLWGAALTGVWAIGIQLDDRVLIGGTFTTVHDQPRNNMARLLPDGSLDPEFDPDADNNVNTLLVQQDGGIMIGGTFTHVGGQPRSRLARLNPDGTLNGIPSPLSATPDPMDFEAVTVGSQSLQSLTLTNTGATPLELQGLIGPLPSPPFFVEALGDSDCGAQGLTLAPDASCTIEVRCAPTEEGLFTGTLQIESTAEGSPTEVALLCEGTESQVPQLAVEPGTVDFGPIEVGFSADAQTVTLSSTGSAPVDVSEIGNVAAPFARTGGDCPDAPFTLEPTESCTLAYDFTPTAAGSAQQSVAVTSNADPVEVQLTGEGVLLPGLSVMPAALEFGKIEVGSSADAQAVSLTSTGSGGVTVNAIAAATTPFARTGGDCPGTPFTLEPTESCTLAYDFTPTAVGSAQQTVAVTSDADPVEFDLAGTGLPAPLPPSISIDPEQLDFQLEAGGSDGETLLIGNAGELDLEWSLSTDSGRRGLLHAGQSAVDIDTAAVPAGVDLTGLRRRPGTPVTVTLPFAAEPAGTSVALTHSDAPDQVTAQNTVACSVQDQPYTRANQFLRAFNLPDFGLVGGFEVFEVAFGVETLSVAQDITVNLYTLDGAFVYANLDLLASETVELSPQETSLVTVPISAQLPAGATLVMEIAAPDMNGVGAFFAGSNDLGETAPSYLAATACGLAQPTTYASIGFPDVHLVMSVTGHAEECESPSWLSLEPEAGTVPGGETGEADLTVDTADLPLGTHEALLCIDSNDPDRPVVTLPVSVEVEDTTPRPNEVFRDRFQVPLP